MMSCVCDIFHYFNRLNSALSMFLKLLWITVILIFYFQAKYVSKRMKTNFCMVVCNVFRNKVKLNEDYNIFFIN